MNITFTHPVYLWFLLFIPILVLTHFLTIKKKRKTALEFANFKAIAEVNAKFIKSKIYTQLFLSKNLLLLTIRILTILFLIFAVSGAVFWYQGKAANFDYALAIDSSTSMLSDDFSPNRFEAAKSAAALFINNLPKNTKIGLISFSGTSFVEQRLIDDLTLVKDSINKIAIRKVGGTDLGQAIITATNLFSQENKKGKSVILLTDGQSNVGISPEEAIVYANKYETIVHTIGVGTEAGGEVKDLDFISKLDEATLRKIALSTGGNYYKATNITKLEGAYKEIAQLKTRIISYDLKFSLILIALVLIIIEIILINTKYRTIP